MNKYEKEQTIYYTVLIVLLVFNVTWLMAEFL
jgi:hypothetical protein